MVVRVGKTKVFLCIVSLIALFIGAFIAYGIVFADAEEEKGESEKNTYIKWAEFNVCYEALEDTMKLDIDSYDKLYHISWIDALSYLAVKNGNNWKTYKSSDIDKMLSELGDVYTVDDLMQGNKYYAFYKEVFSAVLSGFLSEYEKQAPDGNGKEKFVSGYGLVAYSPVAEGFSYSHYNDFGNSRSYGYKRRHLGNDLLGYVGTPIVAVEGGTVECIGWNQYGGWRLGIRSFDGKRSYYYAHLRKEKPYHSKISLGAKVKAGQVIGYMGMTGYSTKEGVNGMSTPHLHLGLQLIFDEIQKEGDNQIWLDVYNIVKLLYRNKATVVKDSKTGEYYRRYDIILPSYPEELKKYID